MNTRSLITKLGKKFPKKTAEIYDYPGLQVGKFHETTNNVLLCLDFDKFVYQASFHQSKNKGITNNTRFTIYV